MSQHFYQSVTNELERGRPVAIATVLQTGGSAPRSSGCRMMVRADGSIVGTIGGGNIEHLVIQDCLKALRDKKTRHLKLNLTRDVGMCCGGEMEVFIDPIEPDLDIVIFGAGHVAAALQPILASIDCKITIIDDRLELAHSGRFPKGLLLHEDGIQYATKHVGGANTYYLVVTHDHQRDQDQKPPKAKASYAYDTSHDAWSHRRHT